MFNDLMIDELARARLTDLYRQAAEERLARTVARSRTPSRVRGLLRRVLGRRNDRSCPVALPPQGKASTLA